MLPRWEATEIRRGRGAWRRSSSYYYPAEPSRAVMILGTRQLTQSHEATRRKRGPKPLADARFRRYSESTCSRGGELACHAYGLQIGGRILFDAPLKAQMWDM